MKLEHKIMKNNPKFPGPTDILTSIVAAGRNSFIDAEVTECRMQVGLSVAFLR